MAFKIIVKPIVFLYLAEAILWYENEDTIFILVLSHAKRSNAYMRKRLRSMR